MHVGAKSLLLKIFVFHFWFFAESRYNQNMLFTLGIAHIKLFHYSQNVAIMLFTIRVAVITHRMKHLGSLPWIPKFEFSFEGISKPNFTETISFLHVKSCSKSPVLFSGKFFWVHFKSAITCNNIQFLWLSAHHPMEVNLNV